MLLNTFKVATRALLVNKGRTFLTTLGIIIGVFSVVMLTGLGSGLQAYVSEQFESLGANTVFVSIGQIFDEEKGFDTEGIAQFSSGNKFTLRDIERVKRLRDYVDEVTYYSTGIDQAKFLENDMRVTVLGALANYSEVRTIDIASGRFFNKNEERSGEKVVVLGHNVATELFEKIDPISRKLRIGNQTFTVVGVAAEVGSGFAGPNFDDYVYAPYPLISKIYPGTELTNFAVKIKNTELIPKAITAIEVELEKSLNEDDFSVFDQSQLLSTITNILSMLTVALGGIAAISLLVGGIGIMNIMLVSVSERTREIGLRKALGATPKQILVQFLIEASLLSILGGLIGLALAVLGTWAIQSIFPAKITLTSVLLAFGVSTAVGLIFGVAPAKRAAELSPIEALRYE
ncbi:MAG: ABC transporter permease [Patescibacteria group bacterium]|jgi:putative ABC transport system permease protein